MKNILKSIVILAVLACGFVPAGAQTILEPAVLDKVQSSVYEVVVEKPGEGSLEYEKKLPLDRIPFAIRNDKYYPIGTAFLMDDGKFYSAAHVFTLYKDTQYSKYYLRDRNGKTYKVDTFTKFSTNRDFVCFTIEGFTPEKGTGLKLAAEPALNSVVFSVGNALGEGIIIRNGVLTSQTPETENGEWKWLRFSAAASPGNSGGPLITAAGDVVGIVDMKSENENLNYALPFAETKNVADNTGIVHIPFYYQLPTVFTERFYNVFEAKLTLPQDFDTLRKNITSDYEKYTDKIVTDLKTRYAPDAKEGFAVADGSAEMIANSYMPDFPCTIYLSDSAKWSFASPKEVSNHQLSDNGVVNYAGMLGYTLAYIVKPDSIKLKDMLASPKIYMDYVLAASRITRNVGGENIAITSLGDPCRSEKHVDRYGRTWLVNYWNLPFVDYMAICYALPMPDGVYTMIKMDSTGDIINGHTQDMSFVADYVYPCYSGELKNWKEYLALPESLVGNRSPMMTPFSLEYSSKKTAVKTGTFSFDIPSSVLAANDDTTMNVASGFTFKDGKIIEDCRSIDLYTNSHADNYRDIFISKKPRPGKGALKDTVEKWEQKRDLIAPYNGEPFDNDQYTCVDKILYPDGITYDTRKDTDSVYLLICELNGQGKKDEALKFTADAEAALKERK